MTRYSLLLPLSILALALAARAQAPIAAGYFEDFESEPTCTAATATACVLQTTGFVNLTNDTYDWIVDIGGTTSGTTGPGIDHSLGTASGKYLYCETSSPSAAGDVRSLMSPKLDLASAANPQIGFWYHMFGATMGTMHVDMVQQINSGTDATFTKDGSAPGIHTINSPGALFSAAMAGDTIVLSGAADPQYNGEYVVATVVDANNIEVTSTAILTGIAGTVEINLTYDHNRLLTDITPSFTDNQDLWQKKNVPILPAISPMVGNAFTANIIIRYIAGTSFTGDAAIDDFDFIDAMADDVGVGPITAPQGACVGSTTPITVRIDNIGTNAQSNFSASLFLDGIVVATDTIAGPLAGGASQTITFSSPVVFSTPGTSSVDVLLSGLPVDGNPNNDFATTPVVVTNIINAANGYFEDFEMGQNGWNIDGPNPSWAFGTPAKAVINSAASGSNAFVTGGLAGQYGPNENGWVESPCFDFSTLQQPIVRLKVFWECEFSFDGMNLQSSIDNGLTWQDVGVFGDPNNWYNDNTITGAPGGSQSGWSGRTTSNNGSNGWVTAWAPTPILATRPNVKFRVAFGTDASVSWEGVAFDDFEIFEPTDLFPGSDEDLQLLIERNGTAFIGELLQVGSVNLNDVIGVNTTSPGGTYDGFPYALVADIFPTTAGAPIPIDPNFPEAHISSSAVVVFDGNDFSSAASLSWILAPGSGSTATFAAINPAFIGSSVMLQSLVLDSTATNGFFAITDALVLEIQ